MLRGAPSYRVRRCLGPTNWTVSPSRPWVTFPSGFFVSALRVMIDPELPAGSESPPFHPPGSTWLLAGIVSALRVMIDPELPAGSESPPFHPPGSTWLLAGIVSALRVMIDQELPGLYTWFEDSSLHVTIRGMI